MIIDFLTSLKDILKFLKLMKTELIESFIMEELNKFNIAQIFEILSILILYFLNIFYIIAINKNYC